MRDPFCVPPGGVHNAGVGHQVRNAQRGQAALARAEKIAGAGLDVFVGEELHPGNPLLEAKNLVFSPHSAAQTREAVINMATMCVEGCQAVAARKKWRLVADPKVYEHEKWKDAEWA